MRTKDIEAAILNADSNLRVGTDRNNVDFLLDAVHFSAVALAGCMEAHVPASNIEALRVEAQRINTAARIAVREAANQKPKRNLDGLAFGFSVLK